MTPRGRLHVAGVEEVALRAPLRSFTAGTWRGDLKPLARRAVHECVRHLSPWNDEEGKGARPRRPVPLSSTPRRSAV
eukprot:16427735-Heterocapsa_arctica.AAC.1